MADQGRRRPQQLQSATAPWSRTFPPAPTWPYSAISTTPRRRCPCPADLRLTDPAQVPPDRQRRPARRHSGEDRRQREVRHRRLVARHGVRGDQALPDPRRHARRDAGQAVRRDRASCRARPPIRAGQVAAGTINAVAVVASNTWLAMRLANSLSACSGRCRRRRADVDSAQILAQAKALIAPDPRSSRNPRRRPARRPRRTRPSIDPQVAAALGTPTRRRDVHAALPRARDDGGAQLHREHHVLRRRGAELRDLGADAERRRSSRTSRRRSPGSPPSADRRAHDVPRRRPRAQVRAGLRQPGDPGRDGGEAAGEAHVAARGGLRPRPVSAVRGRQREGDARRRQAHPGMVVSQRVAVDPRPARLARRRARSIRRRSKARCTCRTRSARKVVEWVPLPAGIPVGFWRSVGRVDQRVRRREHDRRARAWRRGVDPFTFRVQPCSTDAARARPCSWRPTR